MGSRNGFPTKFPASPCLGRLQKQVFEACLLILKGVGGRGETAGSAEGEESISASPKVAGKDFPQGQARYCSMTKGSVDLGNTMHL